ncbi:transposase family protein [Actinomyces sp. oral taxon 448]|uniref:transposase family protein n=1 Tax=Actinomyces sp. oral taxon 448 TaxID=712124 RepID=UPI00209D9EB9|nr:transposase family protein [Actinomyces sp. oral taxon 448]
MRHDLPAVLSLPVTGVLAGCRSLTAIWERAHHRPDRRRPEGLELTCWAGSFVGVDHT